MRSWIGARTIATEKVVLPLLSISRPWILAEKHNIVNFKHTFNPSGRATDDENMDEKTLWGI
jgi:hypothetical protein